MFEVELRELDALVQRLGVAPQAIEPYLKTAMTDSLLAVQRNAMEAAPSATGNYRRSFEAHPEPWVGRLVNKAEVGGFYYGAAIEYGRAPGSMPPVSALTAWVLTKARYGAAFPEVGTDKKKAESVAYAIAKTIQARGLPARKIMGNALQQNEAFIAQRFQKALRKFASDLAAGR